MYNCRDCGDEVQSGDYIYVGTKERLCTACMNILKVKIQDELGIHICGNDSHYFFISVEDMEHIMVDHGREEME